MTLCSASSWISISALNSLTQNCRRVANFVLSEYQHQKQKMSWNGHVCIIILKHCNILRNQLFFFVFNKYRLMEHYLWILEEKNFIQILKCQ